MIVADTNLIAYLLLPGQASKKAQDIFRRDSDWCAPLLWKSEFCNILSTLIRKEMLEISAAIELAAKAESLMGLAEYRIPPSKVLTLAARSKCTAYDCEFVALAEELEVPLVSSDKQLRRAFPELVRTP